MSDYISHVGVIIDGCLTQVQQSQIPINILAKAISDLLNNKWAPAWNVFVTKSDNVSHINSVVYGFAHNNHWMWVNGYGPYDHSFVLWKDYNCYTWVSLESATPTPMQTSTMEFAILNILDSALEAL